MKQLKSGQLFRSISGPATPDPLQVPESQPQSPVERISAHDRYQIEIKREYPILPAGKSSFELRTYIFLPHTLGISSRTYPPQDFYRDLQNYIRLRTPHLSFEQILEQTDSPLVALERMARQEWNDAPRQERALVQFKLLYPIVKAALKKRHAAADRVSDSTADTSAAETWRLLRFSTNLLERYRALEHWAARGGFCSGGNEAFPLMDEALSLIIEEALLSRYERLEKSGTFQTWQNLKEAIRDFLTSEQERRGRRISSGRSRKSEEEGLLERMSFLKKYASEVLYLRSDTKPEGKTVEHLLYAVAAGLAMAFATAFTFASQAFWSNHSVELFAAFVCGYMFKDRIKDIARGWFTRLLAKRLYDHRVLITSSDGSRSLGFIRERMRFTHPSSVPPAVEDLRRSIALTTGRDPRRDVVISHRKEVVLSNPEFQFLRNQAPANGVSDISRLDVRPFLSKMDEPVEQRWRFVGENLEKIRCRRTYSIYIITESCAEGDTEPVVTGARIILNRKGIRRIEHLDMRAVEAA